MSEQPVEVTGVPSRGEAHEIARSMRLLFPDWNIAVFGDEPPFTVRRTPPESGGGAGSDG